MENMNRGYFGIGIFEPKIEENIGTLWRSALIFGASFIFTIGKRYKKQVTDTPKSWKHIPLYHYKTLDDFKLHIPEGCKLIGVELDDKSIPVKDFKHPERCIYVLGAEDKGLTKEVMDECDELVILPGNLCLNVSVAGSLIMYDRVNKNN